MKVSMTRGMLVALGITCGAALQAHAEGYGAPSLLPIPTAGSDYGIRQTAGFRSYEVEEDEDAKPMMSPYGGELPAPPVAIEPVSPYDAAHGGAWSGNAGCATGECGDAYGVGCCNPCRSWWVGANFLYMDRDREDFQQLSFDDLNESGSVLSTDSANMNWSPGFEVFAGRWFCDGAYGLEARYWGIYAENQEETLLASQINGNLNTVFDFQPINIGATNVNDLYDAADAHRVRRSWAFHNFEVNWLQGYGFDYCGCGSSLDVGLVAGVRYFRFDEGFQYASADRDPVFGVDPANEGYYDIDVENHLVGFQLGANASYACGPRFRLRATPKVGVYGNHVSQMQRIYNSTGVAVVGGGPLAGMAYDVSTSKDDVSFLAEFDLGADYRISNRWSVNLGYRAVAITGVALATHQMPRNFADVPGAQDIDNDQSLILHGGYIGATYNW